MTVQLDGVEVFLRKLGLAYVATRDLRASDADFSVLASWEFVVVIIGADEDSRVGKRLSNLGWRWERSVAALVFANDFNCHDNTTFVSLSS